MTALFGGAAASLHIVVRGSQRIAHSRAFEHVMVALASAGIVVLAGRGGQVN